MDSLTDIIKKRKTNNLKKNTSKVSLATSKARLRGFGMAKQCESDSRRRVGVREAFWRRQRDIIVFSILDAWLLWENKNTRINWPSSNESCKSKP